MKLEDLNLPKDVHLVQWTNEKINFYWDFFDNNPFFDNWFSGQTLAKPLIKEIKKHIDIRGNVLEVGFGRGGFLTEVAGCPVNRWGIDNSEKNVQLVSTWLPSVKLGSIVKLPYDNNMFDVVFAFEVFEHLLIEDLLKGILEINRVLKPNSYLVLTVPYDENLISSMALCPDCHALFIACEHVQSFNNQSMAKLLIMHGFEIVVCEPKFIEPEQSIPVKLYRLLYNKKHKPDKLFVIAKKR